MTVHVLDELSTFTALGIRFWDPALDVQVRDGLHVTARPESERTARPRVEAWRTKSDVYAFQNLPGLRAIERRERVFAMNGSPPESPSERLPFIVEIADRQQRYLSAAFRVDLPLPYRGLFLSGGSGSPFPAAPRGFHLYSAPNRRRPSWMGSVRGELADRETRAPIAHALLRVRDPDGGSWWGLSDEAGRFAVFLAFPTIEEGFIGSPLTGAETPLNERSWELRLEVRSEPAQFEALSHSELPDYHSILRQSAAQVWAQAPESGGSAEPEWPGTLPYGGVLTARTEGLPHLLVSPVPSSP